MHAQGGKTVDVASGSQVLWDLMRAGDGWHALLKRSLSGRAINQRPKRGRSCPTFGCIRMKSGQNPRPKVFGNVWDSSQTRPVRIVRSGAIRVPLAFRRTCARGVLLQRTMRLGFRLRYQDCWHWGFGYAISGIRLSPGPRWRHHKCARIRPDVRRRTPVGLERYKFATVAPTDV